MKLEWGAPSDNGSEIVKYTVTRDVGSGVHFVVHEGPEPSCTDSNLLAGATYLYKVMATNIAGDSIESAILSTTASSIPGKIESLFIVLESQDALTIGWEEPPHTGDLPFTKYLVRTDEADYVLGAAIDNELAKEYTKSITQPGNEGRTYRFRVAVENSLGIGPYSDEIQLKAVDPPLAPTLTLDEDSRTLSSVSLKFEPDADTGGSPITGYVLYRDEGLSGSPFSLLYDGSSRAELFHYTDADVITSLTYTYRLHSMNAIF